MKYQAGLERVLVKEVKEDSHIVHAITPHTIVKGKLISHGESKIPLQSWRNCILHFHHGNKIDITLDKQEYWIVKYTDILLIEKEN